MAVANKQLNETTEVVGDIKRHRAVETHKLISPSSLVPFICKPFELYYKLINLQVAKLWKASEEAYWWWH